ncbi:MAG: alpha/beta hydrolase [Rhodobacteraceae bacterium]|nr:alpha/beta hydrolase [Paracoccaceae bacterium]
MTPAGRDRSGCDDRRAIRRLALVTMSGAACLLAAAAAADGLPRIEPATACFVDLVAPDGSAIRTECGHVVVPEDPGDPSGPVARLGYLRVRGADGAARPPLFMIAGGPGSSLITADAAYLFTAKFLGPLLDARDIVLLDQRGAGFSEPLLECREVEAFQWTAVEQELDAEAARDLVRQAIPVCARRAAAQGIELATYNVLSIVADIDAARAAFGYDRIGFYGASYGAQIGQQVLRERPAILEAVVLDGANALSATSWAQDRARDADEALMHLDALCEADAKCASAYDILGLVETGMRLFDEGPIIVTVPRPDSPSRSFEVPLEAKDFASLVFSLQTGQNAVRSLPAFLTELLADGRASVAAVLGPMLAQSLAAARDPGPQETAALAHAAIVCSDDPVTGPEDIVVPEGTSDYGRTHGREVLRQYQELCADVAVPELPEATDIDATADVPTLVLSGALDARTPTFRSEEVARGLPRATLAVFPEGTHVQLGEVNACAAEIVVRFLDDPAVAPPLDCIARQPRRGFILPDGSGSLD